MPVKPKDNIIDANSTYQDKTADLVLISSDGYKFVVSRHLLAGCSPVLHKIIIDDKLEAETPLKLGNAEFETADVIQIFLDLLHVKSPEFFDFALALPLIRLVKLLKKYMVPSATSVFRHHLRNSAREPTKPHKFVVFLCATLLDDLETARLAIANGGSHEVVVEKTSEDKTASRNKPPTHTGTPEKFYDDDKASAFDLGAANHALVTHIPPEHLIGLLRAQRLHSIQTEWRTANWVQIAADYRAAVRGAVTFSPPRVNSQTPTALVRIKCADSRNYEFNASQLKAASPVFADSLSIPNAETTLEIELTDNVIEVSSVISWAVNCIEMLPMLGVGTEFLKISPQIIEFLRKYEFNKALSYLQIVLDGWACETGTVGKFAVFKAAALLEKNQICYNAIARGGTSSNALSQKSPSTLGVQRAIGSASPFDLSARSVSELKDLPTEYLVALLRAQRNITIIHSGPSASVSRLKPECLSVADEFLKIITAETSTVRPMPVHNQAQSQEVRR